MTTLWIVLCLKKTMDVTVHNVPFADTATLDLTFSDGMIGALPVFSSREAAEVYADGCEIKELFVASSDG